MTQFIRIMALVAGLSVGSAAAAQVAADQIAWMPSLAAAKAEAAKRGTAVLVALNIGSGSADRETRLANLRMATDVYRDKRVVTATRKMVCLIASPSVAAGPDGNSSFGHVTADAQKAAWKEVLESLFPGETDVITPQHLLVDSSGKIVERILMERKADAFVEFLGKAKKAGADKSSPPDADKKADDDGSAKGTTKKKKGKADRREVKRVAKLLKSKEPDIRDSAFEQALALLEIEPGNKTLEKAARRYLSSLGRRNIRGAFRTLATANHEGALRLMTPYLTSGIDRVRDAVFGAFQRGEVAESLIKPLADAAKKTRDERNLVSLAKTFARYVPEFPKDKKLFAALNKLAKVKYETVQTVALLAGAHENNTAIRSLLLSRAKKATTIELREAALLGLGKAKVVSAIPFLQKLRDETLSERIRDAVKRALAVLEASDQAAEKKAAEELEKAAKKLSSSIRGPERERRRRRGEDGDGEGRGGRGDGPGGGRGGRGGRR